LTNRDGIPTVSLSRYYARAGADKVLIRHVAEELQRVWDPNQEFAAPDGESKPESHAKAILGILATGADTAGVKGYLRRAEEDALGAARTNSFERGQLAEKVWRLMLDAAVHSASAEDSDAAAT
jgi:hypothetical protein